MTDKLAKRFEIIIIVDDNGNCSENCDFFIGMGGCKRNWEESYFPENGGGRLYKPTTKCIGNSKSKTIIVEVQNND